MKHRYRWNAWNRDHIFMHGIRPSEAEFVIDHASPPFPRQIEDQKFVVHGRSQEGRYLHVIYILDPTEDSDFDDLSLADILELMDDEKPRLYVIHAREMTRREKSNYRRGR